MSRKTGVQRIDDRGRANMPSKLLARHPGDVYRFTKVPIEGPEGHTFLAINPVKMGKAVGPVLGHFEGQTLETYTLDVDKIGRVLMSRPLGGSGKRFHGYECKFMEVAGVPMMVVAPKLDAAGISSAVSSIGRVPGRAKEPRAGEREKTLKYPAGRAPARGRIRIVAPGRFKSLIEEAGPMPEKPSGGARWRLGRGGKMPALPGPKKRAAGPRAVKPRRG